MARYFGISLGCRLVDHLRRRPVPRRAAEAEAADALVVVAAALRHRIHVT